VAKNLIWLRHAFGSGNGVCSRADVLIVERGSHMVTKHGRVAKRKTSYTIPFFVAALIASGPPASLAQDGTVTGQRAYLYHSPIFLKFVQLGVDFCSAHSSSLLVCP
jgi:hypothetical protein